MCFMALTRKLVYISIFTSNHFWTQTCKEREREREREREHRHTAGDAQNPSSPVMPRTTPRHTLPTHPLSLSLSFANLSLILTDPISISHSFFLPLSVWPSLKFNGFILIFVSLKSLHLAIFYYKFVWKLRKWLRKYEKMVEKMWETSRKFVFFRMLPNTWKYFLIQFSKCNQTLKKYFPFRKIFSLENILHLKNILHSTKHNLYHTPKHVAHPKACKAIEVKIVNE